eukprot:Gb_13699 [translate_table: standard]
MLNLYRASHVAFSEEKVMEDARIFTTEYLQKAIAKCEVLSDKNLSIESKYALEYPWKCSVPRWEARNHIDVYGTDEWDVSITDCLPESMRICFKFIYKTRNELAAEAMQHQGRDMFHHIQKQWEYFTGAYLKEAEWKADEYVPTLDEYIKNGINSSGLRLCTFHAMLLMGQLISDNIIRQLEFPASNFVELTGLSTRLTDDTQDFQDDKASGELISSIWSYLKDNPEATEEDALNHIDGIIDHYGIEQRVSQD